MSKISYLNSPPPAPTAASGAWEEIYVSLLRFYRPAFPALIWLACVVFIVFHQQYLSPDNVKEDLFYYLTIIFAPCTLLASFMSATVIVRATPSPDGLVVVIWAESPNSWRRTQYVEEILEWCKVLDIVTTYYEGDAETNESWSIAVRAAEPFRNNESQLQLFFGSETAVKVWTRTEKGFRDAHISDDTQKQVASQIET